MFINFGCQLASRSDADDCCGSSLNAANFVEQPHFRCGGNYCDSLLSFTQKRKKEETKFKMR